MSSTRNRLESSHVDSHETVETERDYAMLEDSAVDDVESEEDTATDDSSRSLTPPSPFPEEDAWLQRLFDIGRHRGPLGPGPSSDAETLLDELRGEARNSGNSTEEEKCLCTVVIFSSPFDETEPREDGHAFVQSFPGPCVISGPYGNFWRGCELCETVIPNVEILLLHLEKHHETLDCRLRQNDDSDDYTLEIYPPYATEEVAHVVGPGEGFA